MSSTTEDALLMAMEDTAKCLNNASVGTLVAAAIAHRVVGGNEHDPSKGSLSGHCAVCLVPWPCVTAMHFLRVPGAPKTALRNAADAIVRHIHWPRTEEGAIYWSDVYNKLVDLSNKL